MCKNNSFWISHKKDLGSLKVIGKYIILWWIVWVIICFGLFFLIFKHDGNRLVMITAIQALIVCFATLILWKKLPKSIFDTFSIRKEMKYFLLVYSAIALMQGIFGGLEIRNTVIGWQISSVVTCVGMSFLAILTGIYPIWKTKEEKSIVEKYNNSGRDRRLSVLRSGISFLQSPSSISGFDSPNLSPTICTSENNVSPRGSIGTPQSEFSAMATNAISTRKVLVTNGTGGVGVGTCTVTPGAAVAPFQSAGQTDQAEHAGEAGEAGRAKQAEAEEQARLEGQAGQAGQSQEEEERMKYKRIEPSFGKGSHIKSSMTIESSTVNCNVGCKISVTVEASVAVTHDHDHDEKENKIYHETENSKRNNNINGSKERGELIVEKRMNLNDVNYNYNVNSRLGDHEHAQLQLQEPYTPTGSGGSNLYFDAISHSGENVDSAYDTQYDSTSHESNNINNNSHGNKNTNNNNNNININNNNNNKNNNDNNNNKNRNRKESIIIVNEIENAFKNRQSLDVLDHEMIDLNKKIYASNPRQYQTWYHYVCGNMSMRRDKNNGKKKSDKPTTTTTATTTTNGGSDSKKIKTRKNISNSNSKGLNFNLFATYLVKELSFENLAFICETIQFKVSLIGFIKEMFVEEFDNVSKEKGMDMIGILIKLPNSIPRSAIVYSNSNKMSIHSKAWLIYKKYIEANEAPFEINISYQVRIHLNEYFDHLRNVTYTNDCMVTFNDYICLLRCFDDSIKQVLTILNGCFSRFSKVKR